MIPGGWKIPCGLALLATGLVGLSHAAPAPEAPPGRAAARPELALQIGHVNTLRAVTFSPDGTIIATAAADRTAKLWSAGDGRLLHSLVGHGGTVLSTVFNPNGKTVLTADAKGGVRLWDVRTGSLLKQVEAPGGAVTAVALNASGTTLLGASAGADRQVRLWKTGADLSGRLETVAVLKGHEKTVGAAAFSRDGKLLATGSADGNVRTWDTEDGSLQRSGRAHAMPINTLAFSQDAKWLLDGSDDGIAQLWNVDTGAKGSQLQMNRPGEGIGAVAFDDDGTTVALAGHPGRDRGEGVRLWDLQTGRERRVLSGHEGYVGAVQFSPNGKLLATGGRDDSLRVWDVQTGKQLAQGGANQSVPALAFAPGGTLLASGAADGKLRLWDLRAGELVRTLEGHSGPASAVAFSPDGKLLATGGTDGRIRLWDGQTGALKKTVEGKQGRINVVAFSPDGRLLAVGHGSALVDGAVTVWDLETGRLVLTLDGQSLGPVYGLAFSPDGKQIATGSGALAGEVRFWDAATGMLLDKAFSRAVRGLAFSRDGKMLATGSTVLDEQDEYAGDEITIWNGRTHVKQRSFTFASPGAMVQSLVFLADDVTVAAGSRDGAVRLWNARTGELVRTLSGHQAGVLAVALRSGANGMLASAGLDNSIRLWEPDPGRLKVTLLPLPDGMRGQEPGNWLAVTPEGYYNGSAGAGRFIRWRVGADLFPVDAYEALLRKPEILRNVLGTPGFLAIPSGSGATLTRLTPPEVHFVTPADGQEVGGTTVKVSLAATDDRKVVRIELQVNGRVVNAKPLLLGAKPLLLGAKPLLLGAKPVPAAHTQESQFEFSAPLPPGEPRVALRATAYDEDGLCGWEQIEVRQRVSGAVQGNLYVVAVGVSKYRNPKFNLKYAASDAAAFAGVWKQSEGRLYKKVIVTELTDAAATAPQVEAAINKIGEAATKVDSIAVFLSGHGIRARVGEFYFATHEVDPANVSRIAATALPWTSLNRALSASRARRVALFLDACHSGSTLGDQQTGNEVLAELLVKRSGALVFASSRGSQYSYELDDRRHGAFTAALVEGLGQGKADLQLGGKQDHLINVEELFTYLRARVSEMTDGQQTPTCPLMADFGEPFPLAVVR